MMLPFPSFNRSLNRSDKEKSVKKKIEPLRLSRETIAKLDTKNLTPVAGASTSPTWCNACFH